MGALTSKPFSFAARSWELLDRLAFDCTDTFFSSVKVSFRGKSAIRVLPDFSSTLLSEWISDRARFSYDSLQNQIDRDSIYRYQVSKLSQSFLHFFFKRFYSNSYFFDFISAQQNKAILNFTGFPSQNFKNFLFLNFDVRTSYYFNFSTFLQKPIFKNYFLFGINFRYQVPVFAVSLRKLAGSAENFFFNFGFFTNNLLSDINFGHSIKNFQNVIRGKSKISRVYYSALSIVFSNPFVRSVIALNSMNKPVYSFYDDPKNLVSAEVFSTFIDSSSRISIYLPHFFSSDQVFPRNNKLQKFDSPIFSNINFFSKFYLLSKQFADFNMFTSINLNFKFTSSFFMYDNFYSHYKVSTSSLNVLLALKRQSNSRSNFIYYN